MLKFFGATVVLAHPVLLCKRDFDNIININVINGFKKILDGECDYLPEQAFLNVGTIKEAINKGEKILSEAKA